MSNTVSETTLINISIFTQKYVFNSALFRFPMHRKLRFLNLCISLIFTINSIYHVKYSVRNSLDKNKHFQFFNCVFAVVEAGYMNKEKSDLREWTTVPNFKNPVVASFGGNRDLFKISKLILNAGNIVLLKIC